MKILFFVEQTMTSTKSVNLQEQDNAVACTL